MAHAHGTPPPYESTSGDNIYNGYPEHIYESPKTVRKEYELNYGKQEQYFELDPTGVQFQNGGSSVATGGRQGTQNWIIWPTLNVHKKLIFKKNIFQDCNQLCERKWIINYIKSQNVYDCFVWISVQVIYIYIYLCVLLVYIYYCELLIAVSDITFLYILFQCSHKRCGIMCVNEDIHLYYWNTDLFIHSDLFDTDRESRKTYGMR